MPAPQDDLAGLERLATQLDSAFRIPGTSFRVGYDSIIGLVPGIGDALTVLPSLYIVKEAHRLGVARPALVRMGVNTGLDFAIGAIPLLGDLFDAGFKANRRNVALLRRDLARRGMLPDEKGPRDGTAPVSAP